MRRNRYSKWLGDWIGIQKLSEGVGNLVQINWWRKNAVNSLDQQLRLQADRLACCPLSIQANAPICKLQRSIKRASMTQGAHAIYHSGETRLLATSLLLLRVWRMLLGMLFHDYSFSESLTHWIGRWCSKCCPDSWLKTITHCSTPPMHPKDFLISFEPREWTHNASLTIQ